MSLHTAPDSRNAIPDAKNNHGHLFQTGLQCGAFLSALVIAWLYYTFRHEAVTWLGISLLTSGMALAFSSLLREPWWWKTIHTLFAPLAWLVSWVSISPYWYLAAFLFLLLCYRGAFSGRIPLFLSNTNTCQAIIKLADENNAVKIADLGAGIGSIVGELASSLPKTLVIGVENAPIPWLIGYFRTIRFANSRWLFQNFWGHPLSDYDIVYAFLSPAPMKELWHKMQREMHPGSLFVSNSFAIPEQEPTLLIKVDDIRKTQLFCYRI